MKRLQRCGERHRPRVALLPSLNPARSPSYCGSVSRRTLLAEPAAVTKAPSAHRASGSTWMIRYPCHRVRARRDIMGSLSPLRETASHGCTFPDTEHSPYCRIALSRSIPPRMSFSTACGRKNSSHNPEHGSTSSSRVTSRHGKQNCKTNSKANARMQPLPS